MDSQSDDHTLSLFMQYRAELAELPERTRVVLGMHRFGGRKLKDIAQCLGISIALAPALVHEGRPIGALGQSP